MPSFEIEVTPAGKIRTVYKDEQLPTLEKLGAVSVHRASNVEWEEIGNEKGWTVRAAHDPELAIRTIFDKAHSSFRRVVSREGDIAVFTTREAALGYEVLHFWELLP
jgi:hypothetical protein